MCIYLSVNPEVRVALGQLHVRPERREAAANLVVTGKFGRVYPIYIYIYISVYRSIDGYYIMHMWIVKLHVRPQR